MRVMVVGGGGRLGRRVLAASVRAGHEATAFVRSKERLLAAIGPELYGQVDVVEGDASNTALLEDAMRGQEAAVQAAGYIGSTAEEGQQLRQLVQSATEAASRALVGARRLWVLGGAGVLDIPGRPGLMLVDVPGFPFPQYRVHKQNFDFLGQERFDTLDWSLACPGVMLDAPAGSSCSSGAAGGGSSRSTSSSSSSMAASHGSASNLAAASQAAPPPAARVTIDVLPVHMPGWSAALPSSLLLPAVAAIRGQLMGPSYDEVAAGMVAHLAPGGPLRHRRVGFAAAGSR